MKTAAVLLSATWYVFTLTFFLLVMKTAEVLVSATRGTCSLFLLAYNARENIITFPQKKFQTCTLFRAGTVMNVNDILFQTAYEHMQGWPVPLRTTRQELIGEEGAEFSETEIVARP